MIKLYFESPVLLQIEQKPICKANDDKLHIVHSGRNAAQRFFQPDCCWSNSTIGWHVVISTHSLRTSMQHKQRNRYTDV